MGTNLYFVRHAHSVYTPDELARPLSEMGMLDTIQVTEVLKRETIDVVLSSPYMRAIQTIQAVAEHFGLEIEVMEDLRERTLAGGAVANFSEAITKVWQEPNFAWEGGESNHTAQQRGILVIEQVLEKYKGKNVVIGSHGNIMALIMNYYDSTFDFAFWEKLDMPDIYKLTFEEKRFICSERLWSRQESLI
ncbi:Phosphoserine phosphatase 1 [Bacillus sp. THAF10]|uniref:histidine phosphatase family protein n=1 Tax=Bacillus sp. THAF10 TaxID=2587848 RepID=UPI00126818A1|nr:histidine phosphatase family protein [Bacillus sp. THAF10]QFT87963.1 Phosphoserine phosphatase 1 [Bacillus sp. THAF10]